MASENRGINIFPFNTTFFEDASYFGHYIREVLPDILNIEHTVIRTPRIIVFAYQGDQSLWGYAKVESWESPRNQTEADVGIEWGGSKFRRLYKIKSCSLREFKEHVPYSFLRDFGFETRSIIYAPKIPGKIFNQVLKKAEGEIDLCTR